jgi:cell fate regulator YaaT (PSP1 superfamily)
MADRVMMPPLAGDSAAENPASSSVSNDRTAGLKPVRPPRSLDEARALARRRFKERLERGEKIGGCDCHSADDPIFGGGQGPVARVVGVRFIDSGRTYFFDPRHHQVTVGDWVVVETSRGKEAGRVVLAPHQVRLSMLQGELKPVLRRLNQNDVAKMERLKRDAAAAVKIFGQKIREHGLPMKPISAEYNFDGTQLTLNFSAPEKVDFRELVRDLAATFRCRVELRQVGPRDEARLLGGLGRCGRALCCASWLPVFPEISMTMAKTQDLPLNPQKVSGVCGRLLCCLSYENEQYKQMKAIMPRLGQRIETPQGPGMVVSLQILKELVTVRLDETGVDVVFPAAELGFGRREPEPEPLPPVFAQAGGDGAGEEGEADEELAEVPGSEQRTTGSRRRRRRRNRARRSGSGEIHGAAAGTTSA